MELVIEFISRNKKVQQFEKCSGNPISIGRAYNNDIIIQDEHVCPQHAEIYQDESGELFLINNDSVNGIKDYKGKEIASRHPVKVGDIFQLGKQFIRILDTSSAVEPTKKLHLLESFSTKINHWYFSAVALLVFFAVNTAMTYFNTTSKIIWSQIFLDGFFGITAVIFISFLIGLFAKIFKKEVKLFTILNFVVFCVLSIELLQAIGAVLIFNWGQTSTLQFGDTLINLSLMLLFLWGTFYLASSMRYRTISIASASLVLLILGFQIISSIDTDEVVLYPQISPTVLPEYFLFAEPQSIDSYTENTDSLFSEAQKEAERRNAESEK
ncbi:FHA domain-containing protein [Glaciecola sp. 1036]|uniref:FHA domain-containing protein n=1 Tax=Alteromonadaceae TaxID=72275 RepID=UPI003D021B45